MVKFFFEKSSDNQFFSFLFIMIELFTTSDRISLSQTQSPGLFAQDRRVCVRKVRLIRFSLQNTGNQTEIENPQNPRSSSIRWTKERLQVIICTFLTIGCSNMGRISRWQRTFCLRQYYESNPGLRIWIWIGSGFNRVSGSGSVFGIRIRIEEGKNDPESRKN